MKDDHAIETIIYFLVIAVTCIALGYYWRWNQELDRPIAREATIGELFEMAQDGYTFYVTYQGQELKVVPRRDGALLVRVQ